MASQELGRNEDCKRQAQGCIDMNVIEIGGPSVFNEAKKIEYLKRFLSSQPLSTLFKDSYFHEVSEVYVPVMLVDGRILTQILQPCSPYWVLCGNFKGLSFGFRIAFDYKDESNDLVLLAKLNYGKDFEVGKDCLTNEARSIYLEMYGLKKL